MARKWYTVKHCAREAFMRYFFVMPSPVGELTLTEEDGRLVGLSFERGRISDAAEQPTPLLLCAKTQLEEYFSGRRRAFVLPLAPRGTPFQQAVWQALRQIPYGETRTYGEIAGQIGRPRAARAVGMASHQNPIAVIQPCHRVIGVSGRLIGYAGGLDRKAYLLRLEQKSGAVFKGNDIPF